ncbi:helix-turn-helix domain-containing protein [Roseibacillus ishigakijimensis]|uniref:Helix-turn-helix transcriptional regulator n=1 Tax=Roseibacillus ishigakijimensis TaxID=454146 RepID=A0A934VLJ3_9BACT|nr:AraC family transcriptional regulator [Roseibacillus ishigakijimensis]MBK1833297.1 helix-turn-helix transcriptional regulator [Roseibacillus ishigakijimensis]
MARKSKKKGPLKLVRNSHQLLTEDGRDIMTLAEQNQFKVAGVAGALDVPVQELENAIKKATGSGPKEYFRRHRIILAQRYLRMGYKADQIVTLLGFSHYTHLAREVKLFYGMTITAWTKTEQARCLDPDYAFG